MLELTERVGAKPKLVKRVPGVSVSIGDTIPFDEADMPEEVAKKVKENTETKKG
jgi:hypothetical protein